MSRRLCTVYTLFVAIMLLLCLSGIYIYQRTASYRYDNESEIASYRKALDEANQLIGQLKHNNSKLHKLHEANQMIGQFKDNTSKMHKLSNSSTVNTPTNPEAFIDYNVQEFPNLKDVIIGMAQDIDPKNLVVFCGSIRSVSTAEVILFINSPVPALHKEILQRYSITAVPFNLLKHLGDNAQYLTDATNPNVLLKYHPSTSRWNIMYSYMKGSDRWKQFRRIWMIDVRDTRFQKDPFDMIPYVAVARPSDTALTNNDKRDQSTVKTAPASFFYAFAENEATSIAQCGWNSNWVKDCFGQEMLEKIGRNFATCSGTVYASMDMGMIYLHLMSDITLGVKINDMHKYYETPAAHSSADNTQHTMNMLTKFAKNLKTRAKPNYLPHHFPQCERNGVDQGMHNVLVFNAFIPHMSMIHQNDGPVALMQAGIMRTASGKDGDLEDGKIVVNARGDEVSVVHQYDRDKELQNYYFRKYCYWMDFPSAVTTTADQKKVISKEPMCKGYEFKYDSDKFKGMCDLDMRSAENASRCCILCTNVASCLSFTYVGGLCYLKNCLNEGDGEPLQNAISGWKIG